MMHAISNVMITLALAILIIFLMDLYIFQGLKVITAGFQSGLARKLIHWSFWVFFIILYAVLAYLAVEFFSTRKATAPFRFVSHLFFAFFIAKVVLLAILFSEDIARFIMASNKISSIASGSAAPDKFMPDRRKIVSQVGLVLAALPFVSIVYGVVKGKYNYKVHRHTLYFDDLPEAFDGFTITQVSDIHAGSFDDKCAVERGVGLIRGQNSDVVVFTGDLVNNKASEILPYLDLFRSIEAPYGKFSILGNHDYGDYTQWKNLHEKQQNLKDLFRYHKEMGFGLLLNEHARIERMGQEIFILGVENWGKGFGKRGDLGKTLQGVGEGAFKILLSHDPSHWDGVVKNHNTLVQLTLSGHTHGMQFGIEVPGFRWSPSQYRYPNWGGLAEEPGRKLYVNRGFGFIGFSGRVGIWPEITVLELRRRA